MPRIHTVLVVIQSTDNAALRNAPLRAFADHARDLDLESLQPLDAAADLSKVSLRDRIDILARPVRLIRQVEKLTNIGHLKPQFTGMADEAQAPDGIVSIEPSVALRARRGRHQANTLIVAYGRHLDARRLRQRADGQQFRHEISSYSSSR